LEIASKFAHDIIQRHKIMCLQGSQLLKDFRMDEKPTYEELVQRVHHFTWLHSGGILCRFRM